LVLCESKKILAPDIVVPIGNGKDVLLQFFCTVLNSTDYTKISGPGTVCTVPFFIVVKYNWLAVTAGAQ